MFKRVRKSILKRWAKWRYPDGFILHRDKRGLWILNHHNFVDRHLGVFGGFEDNQLDILFAPEAEPADAFLDIGANFGLYTINALSRHAAREIVAFEPDPRNAAQLSANLYLNGAVQKVRVRNEAVSDRRGTVILALHPTTSTGTTRVVEHRAENDMTVPCVALDDEFAWRGRRLIIKIDVEGHEHAVLKGMMSLLRHNECFLQVEIFPENRETVLRLLTDAGYVQTHAIEFDCYFRPDKRLT